MKLWLKTLSEVFVCYKSSATTAKFQWFEGNQEKRKPYLEVKQREQFCNSIGV